MQPLDTPYEMAEPNADSLVLDPRDAEALEPFGHESVDRAIDRDTRDFAGSAPSDFASANAPDDAEDGGSDDGAGSDGDDEDETARSRQMYWTVAIADADLYVLVHAVLDGVTLRETGLLVPELTGHDRGRVAEHFGREIHRTLAKQSLDLQEFVRLVGDPVGAVHDAFESRGGHEIAAACYAVTHDRLLSGDDLGHLSDICAHLRFRCARTLAEARPKMRAAAKAMVSAPREGDGMEEALRAEVAAWLDDG